MRPPDKIQDNLCRVEISICSNFQKMSGYLESRFVFGNSGHNGVDTCCMTPEHSATWLVKKVGGEGGGREEAVLDPYGSQLKLIGKSF